MKMRRSDINPEIVYQEDGGVIFEKPLPLDMQVWRKPARRVPAEVVLSALSLAESGLRPAEIPYRLDITPSAAKKLLSPAIVNEYNSLRGSGFFHFGGNLGKTQK